MVQNTLVRVALGLAGIALLGYFLVLFSNAGMISVVGQISSQTAKTSQVLLILVLSLLLSAVFLHKSNAAQE